MEISHASKETQAVAIDILGEAEEVTVSTDAEFMMMIAHGIYSNKALALVRELICNARDGHIKAGKPDEFIRITLTDNKFVIRDHGTGIPNNLFTKIYLTFGSSTKRKSAKETGGFGVGSKVPWAVCDTFSARNWINGHMTVYSIMKSDPKLDGKPSCIPVMTAPSTEPSGVEVTVPFPEKMHFEIFDFIKRFQKELSLNIILNDVKYAGDEYFNITEMKNNGYTLLPAHPQTVVKNSNFYLRLGDVIYPIEKQPEYIEAWNMLLNINATSSNRPLLFDAKPNSVVPTLSRETLQYTEKTMISILELMKRPLQDVADKLDDFTDHLVKKFPPKISRESTFVNNWWLGQIDLPRLLLANATSLIQEDISLSLNRMLLGNAVRWLAHHTPYLESKNKSAKQFREKINNLLEKSFEQSLNQIPYIHKDGLMNVYKHLKGSISPISKKDLARNTWEEAMFWNAEQKANPDIVSVSFVSSPDVHRGIHKDRYSNYLDEVSDIVREEKKEKALDSYSYQFLNFGLYLTDTVVISLSTPKMIQRALESKLATVEKNPLMLNSVVPGLLGARCVRVKPGIKDSVVNKMKAEFESWGYTVVVLLDPTIEERAEAERLAQERAALKAQQLPTLYNLIEERIKYALGHNIYEMKMQLRKLKGIQKNPAYKGQPHYLILSRGKELPLNMKEVSDYMNLVRFVGTDIVCVSTKMEIARVIKEGRISVEDTVLACAKQFFKTPGLHDKLYYENTFFVEKFRQNRLLSKYLFNREVFTLTEQEKRIRSNLSNLGAMMPSVRKYLYDKSSLYSICPPQSHYQNLFSRYAESHFCNVTTALRVAYERQPSPRRTLARQILKAILKG